MAILLWLPGLDPFRPRHRRISLRIARALGKLSPLRMKGVSRSLATAGGADQALS